MTEKLEVVKNRNGEVIDLLDHRQLAKLILETVRNDEVTSAIFGIFVGLDDEVKVDDLAYSLTGYGSVAAIKSIINMAFIVTYCRWKQVFERSKDGWERISDYETFNNTRYTRLFKNAMLNERITLDLQVFALIEAWVGTRTGKDGDDAHVFDGIFNTGRFGSRTGIILQRALDLAKKASFKGGKNDDKYGKYGKYNCNLYCYYLLKLFPVFDDMKFICPKTSDYSSNDDFVIKYSNEDEDIILYPNRLFAEQKFLVSEYQLIKMKGGDIDGEAAANSCFIRTGISGYEGKMQVVYTSFNCEDETSITVDDMPKDGMLNDQHDAIEMRKFLSFDYRNIREVALVISDAVRYNTAKKNIILKEWSDRHKNSEVKIDSDIYWDNIIMLMLVEMGPSDFLELLLDDDELFNEIMLNISRRCIGLAALDERLSEYKDAYARLERQTARKNSRQFKTFVTELRALTVLKSIGFNNKSDDASPFEESLSAKYDCILSCIKMLRQYVDKPDKVDIQECKESKDILIDLFKNIFIFLQIFYEGLDAYAISKQAYMNKQTNDGESNIEERRRQCRDAFIERGRKIYAVIKNQSVSQAYDTFCKTCEKYNKSDGKSFSISEEAKRLRYLITRNYICNVDMLRYYATIEVSAGEKTDIFRMLENFSDKYYSHPKFAEWLEYFKDVFLFLVYNEEYNKRGLYRTMNDLDDKNCDPVYPYIVTYYRENIDRDNLKKCSYRVPIPSSDSNGAFHDKGYVVTLLTEEDYPSTTYFCIPLKYGSTDNWWINPLLIPRDDIVKEIIQNNRD